jgi:hypothetical protein
VGQLGRALRLYLEHLHAEGMSTAGLAPLLVALGIARCARDSAARRVGNTAGTAFAAAYVTYMVVFHLLANLPLDQVRKPSTLDPQASAPNPAF